MWKIIIISLFTPIFFCLVFFDPVHADNVCFECHDRAHFTGRVVHEPISQLRCGTCHNPHVARYKGLLNTREDRLCYSCHTEQETAFLQGIVHSPVADGACSVCHTPHVSNSTGLVRDNLADDCFVCHEKLPREYPRIHKPFAEGQCTACHKPHRADNLDLLTDTSDRLCFSCHDQADLKSGHQEYPENLRGCLSCHNPHGSERAALVRNNLHEPYEKGCAGCHDSPAGLTMAGCLKCHENIREQVLATRSHLTLHEGNSCLNCHSPHAGDTPSMLKSGVRQICTFCHEKTVAGYKASPSRHPNINMCTDCHESHGSSHLSMLRGNGIDVCSVKCHKTQGAFTHPVGPEVLDFQTGRMITCVTCHRPMGTDYKFNLVMEGDRALCNRCHRGY